MRGKTIAGLTFCSAVMLACGTLALAQTPDGQNPSAEVICDFLKDAQYTPGLYGLCVAYCEAVDGEMYDPMAICRLAPSKILDNYNRLRGEKDPMMPCLKPACPCFTLEDVLGLPVKWCEIGIFDPSGSACFWFALGYKERAAVYRFNHTGSAVCQFRSADAIKITEDEAASCYDILTAARGDMACDSEPMMCPK